MATEKTFRVYLDKLCQDGHYEEIIKDFDTEIAARDYIDNAKAWAATIELHTIEVWG